MDSGYSGTPLPRKLGIKPGFRILPLDPPADYGTLVGGLPEGVRVADEGDEELDFIHLFATEPEVLQRRLENLRGRIVPNGMIWISWPKKASGVDTELDGNVVRRIGLAAGLVDVKVCAVDETWSGLKFVIPVKDRS